MKFKLEKPVLIKLLIIGAILIVAPFAVPFSIEFVLMADIMGLEALVVFLIYQSRHALLALISRISAWRDHIAATIVLLAGIYIFRPRTLLSHAAGSSIILLVACSVTLALALWIPAICLSSGGFV